MNAVGLSLGINVNICNILSVHEERVYGKHDTKAE